MTHALFASRTALFRFSVVESLTAIACLGCLYTFGIQSCLHVATASVTFVYCALGEWATLPVEGCEGIA
jgi:hypothetical protein